MKYIKYFLTKLPILSLVLVFAILIRIIGIGFAIANKSFDYKNPVYASVFTEISGEGTLHGTTEDVAKNRTNKKETYTRTKEINGDKKKDYNITRESLDEESSRPVVQAKDYGIANTSYMDEEGTTYNYINDGIFSFNKEVRKFEKVKDDYFNDALFIGDSRSDGLCKYGGTGQCSSFFAMESVTIYNIFDVKIPFHKFGSDEEENTSLENVLSENKFKKIYLAPGMNELGVPDTSAFRQEYINVIERIRTLQPEAIIYIEGILHVSVDKSLSDEVYNNKVIVQRNEAISKLANGYDIFYIDPNEFLCDEDGNLVSDYTNDGVHLTASYYTLWHEYLKNYAIVVE